MEKVLVITTQSGFGNIYLSLLLLLTGLLLFSGIRNKSPFSTWLSLVSILLLGFLTGMKIFPNLLPSQHGESLTTQSVGSVFGGILLLTGLVPLIKNFLKIKVSLFDPIILIIPILGMVQRLNCFFAGCCFGTPTSIPWAITYPKGTPTWNYQVNEKIITTSSECTHPIHPTQLYIFLLLLVVFIIAFFTRNLWKKPGSYTIWVLLLMSAQRFLTEFFRVHPSGGWYTHSLAGLNMLQWIILSIFPLFLYLLYYREKYYSLKGISGELISIHYIKNLFLLFFGSALVWNQYKLFHPTELLLLESLFTLAFLWNVWDMILHYTTRFIRLSGILACLAILVLTSQQSPQLPAEKNQNPDYHHWLSIGTSLGGGIYEQRISSCDGVTIVPRSYHVESFGLAYHMQNSMTNHFVFGLNYSSIRDQVNNHTPTETNYAYDNFNPYMRFDFHYVGFGMGMQMNQEFVYPTGFLRVGPRDRFYFYADVLDTYAQSYVGTNFRLGLGTGFHSYQHELLAGITSVYEAEDISFFISGKILASPRIMVTPSITIGNQFHGSLGFHYYFGNYPNKVDGL